MSSLFLAVNITDQNTIRELTYYQTMLKELTKGDWVDPSTFHITIDKIADKDEPGIRDLVIDALHEFQTVNDYHNQFVFANGINRFDMGATWMGVNESFKLYDMRYLLKQLFEDRGYIIPDRFNGFVPHITMGFNTEKKPIKINCKNIPVLIDNISLWNSPKVGAKNGKPGVYLENTLMSIEI